MPSICSVHASQGGLQTDDGHAHMPECCQSAAGSADQPPNMPYGTYAAIQQLMMQDGWWRVSPAGKELVKTLEDSRGELSSVSMAGPIRSFEAAA